MMRFPDDVVALFDCGTSLPSATSSRRSGREGSLFLDDPWHCRTPVIELRRDDSVERIEVEPANPYRLELEDLSAAIRGERAAAARPRRRDRPGARDRRAVPLGRLGRGARAVARVPPPIERYSGISTSMFDID